MPATQHESKTKLLDATLKVVRAKGYTATRIEDVCAEARLTKGSFFHHFKSKEDLALSAAAHWNAELGEYILDWDDVCRSPDPHQAGVEFARSAFRHACTVCDWDPVLAGSAEGRPPPVA